MNRSEWADSFVTAVGGALWCLVYLGLPYICYWFVFFISALFEAISKEEDITGRKVKSNILFVFSFGINVFFMSLNQAATALRNFVFDRGSRS